MVEHTNPTPPNLEPSFGKLQQSPHAGSKLISRMPGLSQKMIMDWSRWFSFGLKITFVIFLGNRENNYIHKRDCVSHHGNQTQKTQSALIQVGSTLFKCRRAPRANPTMIMIHMRAEERQSRYSKSFKVTVCNKHANQI